LLTTTIPAAPGREGRGQFDNKRFERRDARAYNREVHLDSGPIDRRRTIEHRVLLIPSEDEQGI
jgi:hypothetical protein